MLDRWKVVCMLLAVGAAALSASADITVGFAPVNSTIVGVGNTAQVDIVADIPQSDKILGWGIDLAEVNPSIASWELVSIGPLFTAAYAPDGDGLAGLAGPPGFGVWGNGIVLATVEFTGLALGTTGIFLSDNYPVDLTEGFARDPGGFATVHYEPGTVHVIPEPAALALLGLGCLLLRRR